MEIKTQLVSELFHVLRQMLEEGRGNYGIVYPEDGDYGYATIRQCRVDEENKQLILLT